MYKLFQYIAFSSLFSSSCIVSFQLISLLPLLPPSRLLVLEVRHIYLCTVMEECVLLMESHYFSQTSVWNMSQIYTLRTRSLVNQIINSSILQLVQSDYVYKYMVQVENNSHIILNHVLEQKVMHTLFSWRFQS